MKDPDLRWLQSQRLAKSEITLFLYIPFFMFDVRMDYMFELLGVYTT